MSDYVAGYDGLRLCARCGDQDTSDAICTSCKRELVNHYDGELGWREAWELEKEERERERAKRFDSLLQ